MRYRWSIGGSEVGKMIYVHMSEEEELSKVKGGGEGQVE